MEIKKITTFDEFSRVREDWNQLLRNSHYDILFLNHEWLSVWWQNFAGHDWEMIVLMAYENDELVGAAPIVRKKNSGQTFVKKSLEFFANSHTFRSDFIVANTKRKEDVVGGLISFLLETEKGWDIIKLKDIPVENDTLTVFNKLLAGKKYSQEELIESPFLPIQGSWDDYFAQRSKNHRKNMRRALKKLDDEHKWRLVVFETENDVVKNLEYGFRIENSGWKNENNSSILSNAQVTGFYRQLAETFSKNGMAKIFFIEIDGVYVAFDFCIVYQKRVYALKTGFNEEYAEYSPGQVLQMKELEYFFNSGVNEYDFIGPKMDFKTRWTEHLRSHWTVYIYGNTARGKILYFQNSYILPNLRRSKLLQQLKETFRRKV